MQAKERIFHNSGKGQVIKELSQSFPNVTVTIFSAALVVKSVNLGDLPGFVISSQDNDSVFVSDFEGDKESDSFNTVVS